MTDWCGERLANSVCQEPDGHDGLHRATNSDGSQLRWEIEGRKTLGLGPYLVGASIQNDDEIEVIYVTIPAPQEVSAHLQALINSGAVDAYVTLFLAERLADVDDDEAGDHQDDVVDADLGDGDSDHGGGE